jgi:hypothetical protein
MMKISSSLIDKIANIIENGIILILYGLVFFQEKCLGGSRIGLNRFFDNPDWVILPPGITNRTWGR